ncbi:MAG: cobalt ECF transporter T component CbiQ [Lacrimispora sp.]|uniref:cobalt ECF transporter T component CbiQ n=1 Tax=Lacrimispora sp. TaxID=2719234 RepID=UPI0039E2B550
MLNTIDYYACVSRLRSWNSRLKAAVAVSGLLVCIAANDVRISCLVLLSMSAITIFAGGLSWRKYLVLFRIPFGFLVLGTAAIAIGISREPYGQVLISGAGLYLYVTKEGIRLAAGLVLKASASLSAMYMLVLSTTASEVIGVLQSTRVPKLIVELMNLIYRFIFVMTDSQRQMKQAAESRLGYRDFTTSCRTFGRIGGNLFVVSLKKAGIYYNAMIARCYNGELLFLEEERPVKRGQIAVSVGYVGVLLLVWLLVWRAK